MKRKKILIDANPVVPYLVSGNNSGIGRTCLELIKALDSIPQENMPFNIELYTQNIRGVSAKELNTRFNTKHCFLRNNSNGNKIASCLRLRELIANYDLMHITHNFEYVAHPERCIATIHDAMMFSYPESFFDYDSVKKHLPPFAQKAKAIITCSENSKREIAEYMYVNPDKIYVAPWGVDHNLLFPHRVPPCKYTGGKPYFLSLSCNPKRKNTIAIVKAFIEFHRNIPEHRLILVWKEPSLEVRNLINNNIGISDKIIFVSNISNEELAGLYAGATCTFFPSKYEGFGLPIAESMACGTPVVTCRNSSLEEVGGDAALYVDPDDTSAMAEIMYRFENGDLKKTDLIESNHIQSLKFTWERCCQITLGVYRTCLGV